MTVEELARAMGKDVGESLTPLRPSETQQITFITFRGGRGGDAYDGIS